MRRPSGSSRPDDVVDPAGFTGKRGPPTSSALPTKIVWPPVADRVEEYQCFPSLVNGDEMAPPKVAAGTGVWASGCPGSLIDVATPPAWDWKSDDSSHSSARPGRQNH